MTAHKDNKAAQDKDKSKPLRILMACDTFFPDINGAARFTERLSAGLVTRGHEVHIAAPATSRRTAGTYTELIEGQTLTVHRIPSWRMPIHEWLRFVLPWRINSYAEKIMQRINPDVVHVQSHLVVGRGLSKAAKKRNTRIVATNHIMPENIVDLATMPNWLRSLIIRWGWWDADSVLRRAAAITTPTRRAAEFLERSTPRRGVLAVSCGIDASAYTADLTPRTQKRLVFVGRMTQEKKVDVILRALKLLPADIHLDLVGQGDQIPALKKLAAELGVADRVVFHGRATDEHLRATLKAASIFVIASIADLQSIATLEAMASGLPVIAANAMALPHLVDIGKNGYLFEPGDYAELAQRISQITSLDTAGFQAMQRASLKGIEIHDINRTLDKFVELYRG